MARNLTCPHCERSWDLEDDRFASHRADDIYSDHLRLFCRGTPEATSSSSSSNAVSLGNSSSRSRKVETVSAA